MLRRSRWGQSRSLVLSVLSDYGPKSVRDIIEATKISRPAVYSSLFQHWKRGFVLHTEKPIYGHERIFKGEGCVPEY